MDVKYSSSRQLTMDCSIAGRDTLHSFIPHMPVDCWTLTEHCLSCWSKCSPYSLPLTFIQCVYMTQCVYTNISLYKLFYDSFTSENSTGHFTSGFDSILLLQISIVFLLFIIIGLLFPNNCCYPKSSTLILCCAELLATIFFLCTHSCLWKSKSKQW